MPTLRGVMVAACTLACAATLMGCGSEDAALPPAGSSIFDGLNAQVVTEVLANPDAASKITDEDSAEAQASMAQGIVINFIVCRQVAADYRSWLTTGARPALARLPTPSHPQQPSYGDWQLGRTHLQGLFDSGDPAQVRNYLTGESSCGHWIPAKPGDVSGPTIEDSLKDVG